MNKKHKWKQISRIIYIYRFWRLQWLGIRLYIYFFLIKMIEFCFLFKKLNSRIFLLKESNSLVFSLSKLNF